MKIKELRNTIQYRELSGSTSWQKHNGMDQYMKD